MRVWNQLANDRDGKEKMQGSFRVCEKSTIQWILKCSKVSFAFCIQRKLQMPMNEEYFNVNVYNFYFNVLNNFVLVLGKYFLFESNMFPLWDLDGKRKGWQEDGIH